MCGGGGGGGGGGSVNRVSPPRIPSVARPPLGEATPPPTVKPTPLFTDDVVEKRKPRAPLIEKARPNPLATFVKAVVDAIRTPPIEAAPEVAAPAKAKPRPAAPTARAAPPLPEIAAPLARRPAPV